MSATLSLRLDATIAHALRSKAEAKGTSVSSIAREILTEGLAPKTVAERAGALMGSLSFEPDDQDPWSQEIYRNNWRP
jgi:plasmid stability protein